MSDNAYARTSQNHCWMPAPVDERCADTPAHTAQQHDWRVAAASLNATGLIPVNNHDYLALSIGGAGGYEKCDLASLA